ncbi:hypothetical protein [Paenibacillus paridis]|uniref:hypothetical protein n=1 Tax=Paenibacillus paridis TaxID=2583376 RepID=UPI001120E75E|nr:hypothetical protein [Paenibacillus paridis]
MSSKLVLVEGLPGFGKTTTARLVHDILTEMNIKSQLFLEGDLEHPADYDGVAYFNEYELNALLVAHEKFKDVLSHLIIKQGDHYFLEYRKIKSEYGSSFPDDLLQDVVKYDIYELSLDQNRKLITDKWKTFAENVSTNSDTFIFDCCFIQNPVTMGMIKHDAKKDDIVSYVKELANIVEPLNPLLIYVEQSDLNHSFKKAVKERPKEWSEGFIEYYTNQGYGENHSYQGLEGTLEVLKARQELEREIVDVVKINKVKVDNSCYQLNEYKVVLAGILSKYFKAKDEL